MAHYLSFDILTLLLLEVFTSARLPLSCAQAGGAFKPASGPLSCRDAIGYIVGSRKWLCLLTESEGGVSIAALYCGGLNMRLFTHPNMETFMTRQAKIKLLSSQT